MDKGFMNRVSEHSGYTTRGSHLEKLRLQDGAAWDEFYKKYRAMICGIGAKRRLSPDECEDLMQEVAMICSQKLQNFVYDPSKSRFRTFLYKITENVSFNLNRKNRNKHNVPLREDYSTVPELDLRFMQEYEQFLLDRSLQILKDSISSESYQAFEMLFVRNLPVREVVAGTGMTASALYTMKHRCLKRLRRIISELVVAPEIQSEKSQPAE